MPARFTVQRTTGAIITQSQVTPIWRTMKLAVDAALTEATARGPIFRRWFGGMAARRDIVLTKLLALQTFLNGSNSVYIHAKPNNPDSGYYAHVYQISHSNIGQWIIYLGPNFNHVPSAWITANLTHPVDGNKVRVISHELTHAIVGTNKPIRFYDEHYGEDALTLADVDPEYAAWNADNYGFFIEACS